MKANQKSIEDEFKRFCKTVTDSKEDRFVSTVVFVSVLRTKLLQIMAQECSIQLCFFIISVVLIPVFKNLSILCRLCKIKQHLSVHIAHRPVGTFNHLRAKYNFGWCNQRYQVLVYLL